MIMQIPLENHEILPALRGFLRQLLESGLVSALYVGLEAPSGAVIPTWVKDPKHLDRANPLAPVLPINGARAVSLLTRKDHSVPLGAVLRPCEMRALTELAKLQQASLDNLIVIGMDCPGTMEVTHYLDHFQKGFDYGKFLSAEISGQGNGNSADGWQLRQACQGCIRPTPENGDASIADIHIRLFDEPAGSNLVLDIKEEIAVKLQLSAASLQAETGRPTPVENWLAALLDRRSAFRRQAWDAIQRRLGDDAGMAGLFESCLGCHNCKTACPICYCKTCLFETASFDHEPSHYLNLAQRKGATRMPGDILLFHLTRLIHMSASCVNCGLCSSACPVDIPVGTIFSVIGNQVQAAFDYQPGRDAAEPLPLVTFQVQEWTEVGEAK